MNSGKLRYRAFISYSHADERFASRLHRRLESYRVPLKRQNIQDSASRQFAERIRPVFRDRDELSTANSLGNSIETALDESEALIVLCSPSAAASHWVNEEIRYFRSTYPNRPVLAFIVAGSPEACPETNLDDAAFPLNLLLLDLDDPQGERFEPLAADARPTADGFNAAFLKLVAGLIGVRYDQLRQRELIRKQKRWALVSIASLVLTTLFALMAWRATVARNEARQARAQAELELTSERQTRGFLLSVFELSQPDKARGYVPSVREVLDRAVLRIESTRFTRPVIKSRFLATMGQAYSKLGVNNRSVELLQQSLEVLPDAGISAESRSQRIDSQLELADVLFDMGDYDAAMKLLKLPGESDSQRDMSNLQLARLFNIRGDILSYNEEDDAAMAAYQEALSNISSGNASDEEDASTRSRSLVGMAVIDNFAGDYQSSQDRLAEATSLLMSVFGEMHPDTIWALSTQGSIAYFNGDSDAAGQVWRRLLEISLRIYDETNPEVGTLKNNLGRLLLETGKNEDAEVYLREALAIDDLHRTENFDDKTYILNSLAIARMAQGDMLEARALLEEALPIAMQSNHRMLGQIQAALADVQCLGGETESGHLLAQQALVSNQQEHGEDNWRSHRTAMVLAYCSGLSGESVSVAELDVLTCAIMDRWPVSNYFTLRAREHRAAIIGGNRGSPEPTCVG
ncbi:tetratricopeptide repeat protein [Pseudomonadota bacterium]